VLRGASVTPVKIKTGISDGIFTEVTEGLNEGDRVVTAITGSPGNSAQPNNPFSGASRRF
jgi:HlyD family secretion protein